MPARASIASRCRSIVVSARPKSQRGASPLGSGRDPFPFAAAGELDPREQPAVLERERVLDAATPSAVVYVVSSTFVSGR